MTLWKAPRPFLCPVWSFSSQPEGKFRWYNNTRWFIQRKWKEKGLRNVQRPQRNHVDVYEPILKLKSGTLSNDKSVARAPPNNLGTNRGLGDSGKTSTSTRSDLVEPKGGSVEKRLSQIRRRGGGN